MKEGESEEKLKECDCLAQGNKCFGAQNKGEISGSSQWIC